MAAETKHGLRDIAVNAACLPDSMPAAAIRIITRRARPAGDIAAGEIESERPILRA
jgi:hypothetical protein